MSSTACRYTSILDSTGEQAFNPPSACSLAWPRNWFRPSVDNFCVSSALHSEDGTALGTAVGKAVGGVGARLVGASVDGAHLSLYISCAISSASQLYSVFGLIA